MRNDELACEVHKAGYHGHCPYHKVPMIRLNSLCRSWRWCFLCNRKVDISPCHKEVKKRWRTQR